MLDVNKAIWKKERVSRYFIEMQTHLDSKSNYPTLALVVSFGRCHNENLLQIHAFSPSLADPGIFRIIVTVHLRSLCLLC